MEEVFGSRSLDGFEKTSGARRRTSRRLVSGLNAYIGALRERDEGCEFDSGEGYGRAGSRARPMGAGSGGACAQPDVRAIPSCRGVSGEGGLLVQLCEVCGVAAGQFRGPCRTAADLRFWQDPFGEELHHIANDKIINGRKLVVDEVADLMAARSCHILFIASSKKAEMKQIVESLRGADVLTVGDTKGFAKMGGMINFVLEDDRVRFEVNQTAAEQTGLRISSKLLSVAVLVIG